MLGLDIGDKTVGVAISDPLFMLASPLKTVPRAKKLGPVIDEIARLAENEDIGGLLAGLPACCTCPSKPIQNACGGLMDMPPAGPRGHARRA